MRNKLLSVLNKNKSYKWGRRIDERSIVVSVVVLVHVLTLQKAVLTFVLINVNSNYYNNAIPTFPIYYLCLKLKFPTFHSKLKSYHACVLWIWTSLTLYVGMFGLTLKLVFTDEAIGIRKHAYFKSSQNWPKSNNNGTFTKVTFKYLIYLVRYTNLLDLTI